MNLTQIGQISLTVDNVDTAENFYEDTFGLQKLYHFDKLVFLNCNGVRLFITEPEEGDFSPASSIIYFQTSDMANAVNKLKPKEVSFIQEPHLVSEMEDYDLWMTRKPLRFCICGIVIEIRRSWIFKPEGSGVLID